MVLIDQLLVGSVPANLRGVLGSVTRIIIDVIRVCGSVALKRDTDPLIGQRAIGVGALGDDVSGVFG